MSKTSTLLLFIFLLSLISCNKSDKIIVGFMVPNVKSERYQKEQTYFKAKISELGGEALTASADYDDKLQIQQAHDMISQGASVLVVNSVNMNTAAAIVRDAHDKNVQVIAYDRLINNSDLDYYISFDNIKVGKLMAEYAVKLKPEGNYVLIGGDKADLNAVLVKKGQMEVLSTYVNSGKVKIAYNIYVEDWSGDNAYQELKRFLNLTGTMPEAILSSYDGMTVGCISALNEQNITGDIIITGQDAELEACRNIVNDKQSMTVYKPLKSLAEKAAEIAFKMASKQEFAQPSSTINNGHKEVPSILLDPISVDKNNMKTTVIADGFYTENQVYN